MKAQRVPTAQQIHFYDVEMSAPDKGWVHYTSRVGDWEGVDCRVADVVREPEDINAETLGFMKQPPKEAVDDAARLLLILEAVRVSQFAPTWLDRIMTRSPLRDADKWRSEAKAQYLTQRKERRRKFKAGELVFVDPNSKPKERK